MHELSPAVPQLPRFEPGELKSPPAPVADRPPAAIPAAPARSPRDFDRQGGGGVRRPPRRGVPGWVWLAGSAAAVVMVVVVVLVVGNGSGPKTPDGPPVAAKGPGGGGGKPGHTEVEFPDDFYVGRFEVTQEQWQSVMGNNPSSYARAGSRNGLVQSVPDEELKRFPVDSVSWDDAQLFLAALNKRVKESGWIYRLPTEAEWEFACRGAPRADKKDTGFDFFFEKPSNQLLPKQANFGNVKGRTCVVGSYPPNELGLCDMHGNVWEWVDDRLVSEKGVHQRRAKGGCFHDGSGACNAANNITRVPSDRDFNIGFRLARVLVGAEKK